jgi:hypothetical protein
VNKLVKYLSPKGVHHCNLQLLVVSQTAVAKLPCKLFAVHNGFRIGLKFHTDTISHWHTILHVEEKRLHDAVPLPGSMRSHAKRFAETSRLGSHDDDRALHCNSGTCGGRTFIDQYGKLFNLGRCPLPATDTNHLNSIRHVINRSEGSLLDG